jgi:hypothetical protein
MGFGGGYSIIETASPGPALAAVALPTSASSGGSVDMREIFNYRFPNNVVRDGNYFSASYWHLQPTDPWHGVWAEYDGIGSGVFIDLPDKKGYLTFATQTVGRIGYDAGGVNLFNRNQNVWYFYDYETLGKAALGETSHEGLAPSSFSTVVYPGQTDQTGIAGSCFDPATRRLYVYATWTQPKGLYDQPVVHVYRVK